MTALTPIVQEGPSLRAIAAINGRSSYPVFLRSKNDDQLIHADDLNLSAASQRATFVAGLEPELQSETTTLLLQLAEDVVARRVQKPRAKTPSAEVDDDRPPQFSDDACAQAFTQRTGADFRHTAGLSKWLHFTGTLWEHDSTLRVFDEIRLSNRTLAKSAPDPRVATIVAGARTVAAVERLARADRAHAATVEQWDRDPMVLNTPNGVVDLRTGSVRSHRRDDYCTKITTVSPGGRCPLWLSFLGWATGGNTELVAFLKRVAGYCLTGSVVEHALFFLFGLGGNGKGSFLNQLVGILNGADESRRYAVTAAIDTFTASLGDRHPTELAMLRGARLVSSQETEEGRRWAEARIKSITGGDPITARFMRGDFFTFEPTFKLIIAGNHRPGLRSVDEAMRRRFHLIPFEQTIRDDDRDPFLGAKLKAEWPGILEWMIEGCLEWQEMGLRPPAVVRDATAEYLEGEDSFSAWLEECCVRADTHWASVADLFKSWAQWAERSGERPGTATAFSKVMQSHGFERARNASRTHRGFRAISLRSEANHGFRL
jgi:putative DNA primase/helicase